MSVPATSARSSQSRVALPSRSKLALKSRAVRTGSQYTGKRRLIRVLMVAGEYLSSRPVLDELDYLPIDKHGADLLFQDVAARYEVGSIVISTNRPFREWGKIFDVDNTMATALIDRLMHHGEGLVIQGDSYLMKDKNPDSTDQ
jgi:hypothetical protein